MATTAAVVLIAAVGALLIATTGPDGAALAAAVVGVALAAAGAGITVVVGSIRRSVLGPLATLVVRERLDAEDAASRVEQLRSTMAIRDRFDRAVATVDAEAALLRLMVRAAAELLEDHDVALLLSLPDEPRVAWSVRMVGDELQRAEPLPDRPGCTALARGGTTTTASATRLDACGHLTDASATDRSAVCVPLMLVDRTLGVLCVTGPPGDLPDRDGIITLEHIAATTGDRLARLRRRKGPSTPGPVDPVTGLPTSAAFRARVGELVRSHVPFCVAVMTVDGTEAFKSTHGPTAWDDAMRLIGDTAGGTLRPDDVVCRLDGDRIVAVLAGCSTTQAAAALERVRESLVLALTVARVAHFTCSIGLVDGTRATSVDEIAQIADAANHAALLRGGNRVVVADPSTGHG